MALFPIRYLNMSDEMRKTTDLPKAYDPASVEDGIYARWEASGLFNPDNLPGERTETYTIMMPPPNATGTLHVGHAMFMTLQDLVTRFQRMRGKAALWVPGTDHAALATNAKVEKILAKEGKTKHDLGQEKFVERVNEFIAGSQGTIRKQIRKMGSSCDWSREAYTFDEPRSRVVREVFVRMYEDGLIYRGTRIVNWCPGCQSAVADDEVKYEQRQTPFYYFKYGPVVIGTARPETKFLDKTIVVHLEDDRYKHLIGTEFDVEWIDGTVKANVIADPTIDMSFGTGAMTITPAHDFHDFELAQQHGLPIVQIIDEKGDFTAVAGSFAGKNARESRAEIVKILTEKGLVERIDENYVHNLSVCDRSGDAIEPLTSKQWFVAVNKPVAKHGGKTLKEMSLDAVKSGSVTIIPDRFEKVYDNWMENLHDWCISRQIWFGHRIPVWYCATCHDGENGNGVIVATDAPASCPTCGGADLRQDPDALDTWFSSGTWTFSALGWPDNAEDPKGDFQRFHPTQLLETGYDIIFFWDARMILMTTYVTGTIPFEKVYLHGLVRDEQGRKMSKSLGNILDPLDVAAKYGTDAVRLSLTIGNTPGNDLRISDEKIAYFRNFTNKLWNISRFALMNVSELRVPEGRPEPKTVADRWILNRLDAVTRTMTADLEHLNLGRPAETLRDFTWGELADWYLEIAKVEGGKDAMLSYVLDAVLKLWHPFMPFVTEEIYSKTFAKNDKDFLMVAAWPEVRAGEPEFHDGFDVLREVVTAIRNIRSTYNVEAGKRIEVTLISTEQESVLAENAEVVKALAKVEALTVLKDGAKPENAASALVAGVQVYVPLGGLVDAGKEKERITKEIAEVEKYAKALEGKLGNADFTARAPEHVVETERGKLADAKEKAEKLRAQLAELG